MTSLCSSAMATRLMETAFSIASFDGAYSWALRNMAMTNPRVKGSGSRLSASWTHRILSYVSLISSQPHVGGSSSRFATPLAERRYHRSQNLQMALDFSGCFSSRSQSLRLDFSSMP